MDGHVRNPWQPGTIVRLDREKYQGVVRFDEDTDKEDLPFDRSKLALDERFIKDVIVGTQFFCEIRVDDTGARRIESMYPRDNMCFNGVIKDIRRLEGIAEVTPETLATTVAFSRTHLARPDDFKKLRVGDKVRIEMDFYNLISKRKPPRATRVHLSECLIESESRLRPALRRSSSLSHQTRNSEPEPFNDYGSRPRSSSRSRSFDEDLWATTNARHVYETSCLESEPGASLLYNRPNPSMLMPTTARSYHMQAHGQFMPLSPPSGWVPQQYGSLAPACMPLPVHGGIFGQPYQGSLPFYSAGSYPGRSPWVPPACYRDEFDCEERELPTSTLNRPSGSMNRQVDDSDVVIEMTVEELRRLMSGRPVSRSRDHDQ